jgi:hypothetical protein
MNLAISQSSQARLVQQWGMIGIPGVVLLFPFLLQVECLGGPIPFFWMVGYIGVWKTYLGSLYISASFTGDYCR